MFPRPPKICALPEKIGATTKKPLPKKICAPTKHTLTPVFCQKTHCRPSLFNPKTSPNASRLLATSPESHCCHSYASKPPKLWLENPLIEHRYNPSKNPPPPLPPSTSNKAKMSHIKPQNSPQSNLNQTATTPKPLPPLQPLKTPPTLLKPNRQMPAQEPINRTSKHRPQTAKPSTTATATSPQNPKKPLPAQIGSVGPPNAIQTPKLDPKRPQLNPQIVDSNPQAPKMDGNTNPDQNNT